jgi:hypothetical protein
MRRANFQDDDGPIASCGPRSRSSVNSVVELKGINVLREKQKLVWERAHLLGESPGLLSQRELHDCWSGSTTG